MLDLNRIFRKYYIKDQAAASLHTLCPPFFLFNLIVVLFSLRIRSVLSINQAISSLSYQHCSKREDRGETIYEDYFVRFEYRGVQRNSTYLLMCVCSATDHELTYRRQTL